ncbi:uncharacterized protein [Pempheris klunzingeri]|uniref:uncharacterized protein n=1 Tax=Pempheris klunzingeri TaxID=3127111 RepID=UPI00397F3451
MMMETLWASPLLLLTLLMGVCAQTPEEIYVKAGEMVALQCPYYNDGDAEVMWTSHAAQETDLTNMSSAEQRQTGVLVHGRTLVILSASAKHQGNYSCFLGNVSSQSWFRLTVYTTQTRDIEESTTYSATCFAQHACTLNCPEVNIPPVNTPNITSNGIIWHKKGESLLKDSYFSSVEKSDGGVYTCTRSYLYHSQIYNMTITVLLVVHPSKKSEKPVILSPRQNDVFYVDVGSTVVIDCKAVMDSYFDEVFWLSLKSFVETNDSLPVFYNSTWKIHMDRIMMTASLVFRKVSEEDLSKHYTCKLESVSVPSSFVTITLAKKGERKEQQTTVSLSLALTIVITLVVIVAIVVVCVKLKMDIALVLRDTLHCYRSTSDGKGYDAFLVYYKSDTDTGLHEDDRKWLQSVLEERFGYSLCRYDRDVLRGNAVADAVLDCIEQSRTVVLVPTSPDPGLESGLLGHIHAALVEQQTRLILIRSETTEVSRSGVCAQTPEEIYVKAGEMVALQCNDGDAEVMWTSHAAQETDLTNMSSAEQRQTGVLVHGRTLVILSASAKHQGNYSCSQSSQSWFRLTVYTTPTRDIEESTTYPATCFAQHACTLNCPEVNIPPVNTPNITSNGIIWHKRGQSYPKHGYFEKVEEEDRGFYICTRSYFTYGQIYNMTFTRKLDVYPNKKPHKSAVITSPQMNDVFEVDLGSTVVIPCKAVDCSKSDALSWLFVKEDSKLSVFYNSTRKTLHTDAPALTANENNNEEITASLVFQKVSEEDLSKNYTCKLESLSDRSRFVTISLAKKSRPSYVSLVLGNVSIVVVMVFTVVIYVKFKINITLFLRDTLGCHRRTSDGKSYDAFLMYYKNDTDAGLNEHDRKWLKSILEERFGYSLCLYDRDILPGNAVADAVLDCIEQSRTVVLVPTSPDPGLESGLLSAIHAALVERQTRLVLIRSETTEVSRSGSLPKALQLLGEAGNCVTWKGISSMPPSSSFWKQLRYYLPAPQHAPKLWLLPQTV